MGVGTHPTEAESMCRDDATCLAVRMVGSGVGRALESDCLRSNHKTHPPSVISDSSAVKWR